MGGMSERRGKGRLRTKWPEKKLRKCKSRMGSGYRRTRKARKKIALKPWAFLARRADTICINYIKLNII